MNPIYLDNNATTQLDDRVREVMDEVYRSNLANPASSHRAGRLARRFINEKSDSILQRLGAEVTGNRPDRLIFTSGGTESNNLAIFGLTRFHSGSNRIIVSSIEHPSIAAAAEKLELSGVTVDRIDVNSDGVISLDQLEQLLDEPAAAVSIINVNNETGVIQPVDQAARLCRQNQVLFHTDAVQAVGKRLLAFSELDAAAMTISAHKIHGPVGIGGLILKSDVQIEPLLYGGFQQFGTRPGTESPALIAGFAKAVELAVDEFDQRTQKVNQIRERFEQNLIEKLGSAVRVIGDKSDRAPHTTNLAFLGLERQALLIALDLEGICCSTGSACASGSSEPSPILVAMGCSNEEVQGALRFSFSIFNETSEIDKAVNKIVAVVTRLQPSYNDR